MTLSQYYHGENNLLITKNMKYVKKYEYPENMAKMQEKCMT